MWVAAALAAAGFFALRLYGAGLIGATVIAGIAAALVGGGDAAAGLISAVALSAGVAGVMFGRSLRRARCLVSEEMDPASAIPARLRALIAEVKDLRRHGVVSTTAAGHADS